MANPTTMQNSAATPVKKKYRLRCKLPVGDAAALLIVGGLLSVLTLGIAAPFFMAMVVKEFINETSIEEV